MRHVTLGGDFDAHWVVGVVQRSAPLREESARDSTARSGAAVRAAHPSRVRSMRPWPSTPITTVQIAQRKTLGRTRRDGETGRSPPACRRELRHPAAPRAYRRRRHTAGLTTVAPTGVADAHDERPAARFATGRKSPLGNGMRRIMNHHSALHRLTLDRVVETVPARRTRAPLSHRTRRGRMFLAGSDADIGSVRIERCACRRQHYL